MLHCGHSEGKEIRALKENTYNQLRALNVHQCMHMYVRIKIHKLYTSYLTMEQQTAYNTSPQTPKGTSDQTPVFFASLCYKPPPLYTRTHLNLLN